MLIVLIPPAAIACAFLVDDLRIETILFMVGISMNALTASWYFAGTGQPRRLIRNEGLVRLVVCCFSAVALVLEPLAT